MDEEELQIWRSRVRKLHLLNPKLLSQKNSSSRQFLFLWSRRDVAVPPKVIFSLLDASTRQQHFKALDNNKRSNMSSFLLCGPCSASVSSSSLLLSSRRHATNDGSNSFSTVLATQNQRKTAGKSNALKIVSMGNVNEGGVFAPLVVAIRPIIGVKRFNQLRGKAISLHSQVIGDFCSEFGATTKQRQKLIKTAKANGGRLGFLA